MLHLVEFFGSDQDEMIYKYYFGFIFRLINMMNKIDRYFWDTLIYYEKAILTLILSVAAVIVYGIKLKLKNVSNLN